MISQEKFPLINLLYLYENGPYHKLYTDYMAGFKLLVDWLGPEFSYSPSCSAKVPRLHNSYEMHKISEILNIPIRVIYGHSLKANQLFKQAHIPCVPEEVSVI